MRRIFLLLAVLALAAVGLAACGGDDDGGDGGATATTEAPAGDEATSDAGGSQVQLAADPSGALAYEQSSLNATATAVTIDFTNEASIAHDVRVEDGDGNDVGGTDIFAGSAESATLDLEPGEYTFFCSVPGHRQAGMEGTLTVE
jgi:plastocyanin